MFADDGDVAPLGKVWAVEAYPANSTPSLLLLIVYGWRKLLALLLVVSGHQAWRC